MGEMGAEPGEETLALVERVRRGRGWDPDLRAAYAAEFPVMRPPLVGREEELKRLLEVAARASTTRRSALLMVEGVSGTGKTRLLEEALAFLRLDGVSVAAARAVEGDRTQPWSGILALARGGLLEAPGVGRLRARRTRRLCGSPAGMGRAVSGGGFFGAGAIGQGPRGNAARRDG